MRSAPVILAIISLAMGIASLLGPWIGLGQNEKFLLWEMFRIDRRTTLELSLILALPFCIQKLGQSAIARHCLTKINLRQSLQGLPGKVGAFLSTLLINVGVIATLFIAVNVIAMLALNKSPEQVLKPIPSIFDVAVWPQTHEGQEILKTSMGEETAQKIKDSYLGMPNPFFAMHPTLHYIVNKTENPFIHIGLEGVRYLPGWTDDDVRGMLHGRDRPLILLLGGSTTQGHGLRDDETISAYLQKKLGDHADVLNLGAGAYDQIREIDRLEYLLRQGIRPTAVIFLDGVNDMIDIARSNYRWNDKIIYHGMIAGRGDVSKPDNAFNINTSASVRPADFAVMLSQALPATRYVLEKLRPQFNIEDIKPEIDPFMVMPFNYREQEYLYSHWAWFGDKNLDLLKRETEDYYTHNTAYISGLATAFNFKAIIFYQPNGMMDQQNPFNGKGGEKLPGYKYISEIHALIRRDIQSGKIPMIDLNGSLQDLSSRNLAYIDPVHYSPQGNSRIAEIYSDYLSRNGIVKNIQ